MQDRTDAPKTTGWQPIETAPKDDDTLLLWKPDERHSGELMFVGYWSDEPFYGIGWVPVAGNHAVAATHWMPLPEPPK